MVDIVISENTSADFAGVNDCRMAMAAPTTNFVTGHLEVSKWELGADETDSATFFDLSGVPAGSTITNAQVRLNRYEGNAAYTIDIRGMLVTPVFAQMTWNESSTGVSWSSGGARGDGVDRSGTISGTMTVDNTNGYKISTNMNALVQAALASGIIGFQWERNGSGNNEYNRFRSSEAADGERPELLISYTPPGNTVTITEDSLAYGATGNFTTNGLGAITSATLTDSQSNIISVSFTATTFTIPALADEIDGQLTGTVTLTVGDGTNTAQDTFTLTPPANMTAQAVLPGFSTTPPSTYQDFSGTVQVGEQSLYVTLEWNEFDGLGGGEVPSDGTYEIFHISLDGRVQSYDIIFADGQIVTVTGDSRNSLLAQIVVKAGGTVTDPNNRNQLLQDWLDALTP